MKKGEQRKRCFGTQEAGEAARAVHGSCRAKLRTENSSRFFVVAGGSIQRVGMYICMYGWMFE